MEVRTLVDNAELAQSRGDFGEVERLLTQARSKAPGSPVVLGACGVSALRAGKANEAKALFEQAIGIDGSSPRMYLNLASALRDVGDADAEFAALQTALALDPYFSLALFQKASLLEKLGDRKLAAGTYQAALSSIRPGTQLSASLQPVIQHAQRCVQTNFQELEAFMRERLAELRARHADQPQDRVDDCLAALTGKKRIYVQQPTFAHFPRLPAIEFYERSDFPWLANVESATDGIRNELEHILETSLEDFAPYVTHPPQAPLNQWTELNHSRRWSSLFLFQEGRPFQNNLARCPLTEAALANAPVCRIRGRGPTAFFSRLEPHTRIPPHTGVTNTRLTVHLPLVVPASCRFRVGSSVREWQPGTALIFDDTIEHEAWNDSDSPRVVLIFDIWNPLLSHAERELMAEATTSIAEYYGVSAPAFTNG